MSFLWDISDIPIFVKGGSVLPMIPEPFISGLGNANNQFQALSWVIYPGATTGTSGKGERELKIL